jgi:iron complex transport system ATP-binding protein
MPLLELRDLSVSASGTEVLSSITLTVLPGEWRAIVGPNGAGKTTLLRACAGILPLYRGSVQLAGREISTLAADERAGAIAFVPQRLSALPPFTVQEFLNLSSLTRASSFSAPAVEQILEEVIPKELRSKYLPSLSGGELQRAIVGAALAQGATTLLFDEPTNHLDPKAADELQRLLMALRQTGRYTTIVVSHDLGFAIECSDRLSVMKGGSIAWSGESFSDGVLGALEAAFDISFSYVRQLESRTLAVLPGRR